MGDVLAAIGEAKTALVFVNTRSQAERTFQELWRLNEQNWPIALHHGSLSPEQRRKVEAAMARGALRAVVCTSTLDLGIDWGAVDKVICIGAPKGAARLVQRIGRANHRLDEPSAGAAGARQPFRSAGMQCRARRGAGGRTGWRAAESWAAWMCWPSMCWAWRWPAPFDADALYEEVRAASPYAALTPRRFRCGGGFRRHRRLCAEKL